MEERGGLFVADAQAAEVLEPADRALTVRRRLNRRGRVGMMVAKDGPAHFMLIDNDTRGVAKLISDGKGGGGGCGEEGGGLFPISCPAAGGLC